MLPSACQCNGHAECLDNKPDQCKTCDEPMIGSRCENCRRGYYGHPFNGQKCKSKSNLIQ